MIARSEGKKLIALAEKFPVVCVTGPRQSGKTTLVKSLFPNHEYVNLENPEEREFARTDPKGFLARVRGAVILDEAQRVPDLFSWLQVDVDASPEPGRFILTGSQQFLMMRSVTQSLAGRVAVLSLFPFTFSELVGRPPFDLTHYDEVDDNSLVPGSRDLNEVLYQGMYPPIHDRGIDVVDWMANYLRTYVERDVRELVNIGDLETFGRFVRLCAGRSGQLLDLSGLGAEAGVSHTTARRWISVLVASGLVLLLAPHHANFNKRLTKTPKLYFIDTGLLCHLLRVRGKEDLAEHPFRGGVFETFVVSELHKTFAHAGLEPPLFFWRDLGGHEVDILIDLGSKIVPVEVKSGATLASDALRGLHWWTKLAGERSGRGVLVYGGEESFQREGLLVRPWHRCS